MKTQRVLFLPAAALAAAALPLHGQAVRQVAGHSQSGTGNFGEAVTQLGDWTGDGVSEYAVGAPFETTGGPLAGQVRIFDGQTGGVVRTVNGAGFANCGGFTAGDQLGFDLVDIADVDNDGKRDLLATRPGAPRTLPTCQPGYGGFRIIHSNPATPDFNFTSPAQNGLGAAAAGLDSVGGVPTFVVSTVLGAVEVWQKQGASFVLVRTITGPSGLSAQRLCSAGTVGVQPAFAANALGDQVFVIDIQGVPVQFLAGSFGSGFGQSLAPLAQPGQLHALVIGSPFAGGQNGRVDVIDSSGQVVTTLTGAAGERLGLYVGSGGDVDGDGDQDFLASSSLGNQVKIADRNGNLAKRTIVLPAGAAATALDVMPDMQGNGHAEVLVGAAQQNQSWIYFGGPDAGAPSVTSPCSIGTANLPTLGLSADPIIGTSPSFAQTGATAAMPGVFYAGVVDPVGTVIPPGPCRFHLLLSSPSPIGVGFVTDAMGNWSSGPMTMPFPVGIKVGFQALTVVNVTAPWIEFSNTLELTLGW